MLFSERFNVDHDLVRAYGAVDISLVCDIPLFIDPMLIFNSEKAEYAHLHKEIIRYFSFLYTKSIQGLRSSELGAWFIFSEVPNNWLGYSLSGNKGLALGKDYAEYLYKNIGFAIQTNGISRSAHIEKVMLLYEKSGKDKISDLTVNLIKGFLCKYTEIFAMKYINPELREVFPVEKAYFNYQTESFVTKEYDLPFVINEKNEKEYVLLTPYDILREGEPAINRKNFIDSHIRIREAIDNDALRTYVNNYISLAVRQYLDNEQGRSRSRTEKGISRIEKEAFAEMAQEYPELYDYYIKLRENDKESVRLESLCEVNEQIEKLVKNAERLIALFRQTGYSVPLNVSSQEETLHRLKHFKHIIEDCDGYKNLWHEGTPIAKENDLQRLFRFVWNDTAYKVDSEANNGRGQADFIVSMGAKNQTIIEFKLASNSSLGHIFTQVKIYEAANCAEGSLIAIFFFTEDEERRARKIVEEAGYKSAIGESIFLIDCRNDNKISASNPNAI